ncbi:MBL fold metallo-hydrolase [Paracoccus denitrificans]|uniref:RNAse Z n=1 Tax=Paracoccus denitrificans (strain Pd 1222) TaxID=318586 RepID=A1AYF4_PARDP|nr:MBL fold metallo-hydrolase [Paracoccus denitrificans]ABL68298.1 RNAse Z [Paracoccus denitrificans PD1222]MBB4627812.1 ribonuclease BN (tRNA processing enzyme) [Paracoccus denitrificans]MCU7428652.1 MBL fold metallo-hydrolase [Paracoccus denitrificans]QAR26388.1 MBL fold metallo-hydrolase [Paracoccus denitrificans]WQO32626.1 MBL fold metallo-hydrolase [Paracoccus denitrificans]
MRKRWTLRGLCASTAASVILMASAVGAEQGSETSDPTSETELVILGGGAGRTSYGGDPTGGFSAAVVVGEDRYIVDFGRGWQERYYEAGLGNERAHTGFSGLEGLKAGFVTHLHSDHIIDLPRLLLFGSTEGLRKRTDPVVIVGPASRGDLPPLASNLEREERLVSPENPTPGIKSTVEQIFAAYASDLNDNIRDSGMPHPDTYIEVREIALPEGTPGPDVSVAPEMAPFEIYRDENISVSAILVDHAPMYPSYALRFETPDGVIVFSGDTNMNPNLVEIARDADILVLEVISTDWANNLFPEPRSSADIAKLHHLLESHTPVEEVGQVAAQANVGRLVLSHLAPATVPDEEWLAGVSGFEGEVLVGRPLLRLGLSEANNP